MTVGEARLGADLERHPHAVGRHLDGFGEVAVAGRDLVGGAVQQRLPDMPAGAARGGAADAGLPDGAEAQRRIAAKDVGVEAVEAADLAEHHLAALGCVRVDIGQGLEVGRQCGSAEDGQRMAAHRRLRPGRGG